MKKGEYIARYLLSDNVGLSQKFITWDVPADLIKPSELVDNPIIGVGKWKNKDEYYLLMVQNGELIILDKPFLQIIKKVMQKRGV